MPESIQHWQDFYAQRENFSRVFIDLDELVAKSRSTELKADELARLRVIAEKIDRMLD